jgi:hypothetical protein
MVCLAALGSYQIPPQLNLGVGQTSRGRSNGMLPRLFGGDPRCPRGETSVRPDFRLLTRLPPTAETMRPAMFNRSTS